MVASVHYGSMKLLIAARLLVGLACGAHDGRLPVYLGELAPPRFEAPSAPSRSSPWLLVFCRGLGSCRCSVVYTICGILSTAAAMLVCAGLLPLAPTPQSALEDARIACRRAAWIRVMVEDGCAVELCKNLR